MWTRSGDGDVVYGGGMVNDVTVGPLGSARAGELVLPHAATAPYPAVIVLHGCNGVSPHVRQLAKRLADWGYAALVVDSFGPRGLINICDHGGILSGPRRVVDVFAAAAYLRGRKDIDPAHIGAIGLSHGGWTVAFAATERFVAAAHARPLQAIIAYYPWCPAEAFPLVTDVQIFIGSADDWTPAARCIELAAKYPRGMAAAQRVRRCGDGRGRGGEGEGGRGEGRGGKREKEDGGGGGGGGREGGKGGRGRGGTATAPSGVESLYRRHPRVQ